MTTNRQDAAKRILNKSQRAILEAHDDLCALGLSDADAWTLLAWRSTPCGITDRGGRVDLSVACQAIDAKLEAKA